MKTLAAIALAVIVCVVAGCQPPAESNPAAESAGVAAANKWLPLLDEGKDGESWDEAGQWLQQTTPRQMWCDLYATQRRVMGKLVSRAVESKQYATTFPGRPDGEYVMIQYKTVFEKKKAAGEMVVVSLEEDGTWRAAGYLIR